MTKAGSKKQPTLCESEREALLEAMMLGEPELAFTPRGNPDPRLIRLARLLGRQAALESFKAQEKASGNCAS